MTETASNNKRIAKNTFFLYLRMILKLLISLYTSRLVLNALGVEDYGIYSVIYGLVSVLVVLNSSLTNVIQRYLNIGIAKNNRELTQSYFSQGFSLLCIFSIVVLVIGETIGFWFILNKLVIPDTKIISAIWVYQCVLGIIICEINQSLFIANIIANENMQIYAYLSILDAIAKLAVAVLISFIGNTDLLIIYAICLFIVAIIMLTLYIICCFKKYNNCKIKLIFNRKLIKEMGTFVGYNAFGSFAWAMSYQGVNVILNLFFGPIVNAAKGIATQVISALNGFTYGILTAFKPPIISAFSTGNISYLISLFEKCTKYSFIMTFIFVVPLLYNLEYVLYLWLGETPIQTRWFVLLSVIDMLVFSLSQPIWIVVTATGNIRKNQLNGRLITLMSLPLSYIILCIYQNEYLPLVIIVIMQLLYYAYALVDVKKQLGLNIYQYLKNVFIPITIISSGTIILLIVMSMFNIKNGIIPFLLESIIICIIIVLLTYLTCTKTEKETIIKYIKIKLLSK